MAQSDFIALNSNFDQWKKTSGAGLTGINLFNYYAIENFLKDFPVSHKEIMAGAVDKSGDGGIDAFYFFANRKFVFDDAKLEAGLDYNFSLMIFQCKEGSGFSPVEIGKVASFASDLLDPQKNEAQYAVAYHAKIKALIRTFKDQFNQVAGSVQKFEISFYYISKLDLDASAIDSNVTASENNLRSIIKKHFPKVEFTMHYISAEKLIAQARIRKRNEKSLKYSDSMQTEEGWITLVKLPEFYKFLQDEQGNFHEQILEENVRGFLKKTSVNEGIKQTLSDSKSAEFWLLNNGVTILTEGISPASKATLKLADPQIVNGLQSSRHVYDYFKNIGGGNADDVRRIVVRVIETKDDAIRDQIINATNSQNKIAAEALRATEPIQRKIEDLFASFDLYYDRRKGHHKDKGKPVAKIVSVREALQANLAVVQRLPDAARARPSDYLDKDDLYKKVYLDETVPLTVHVKSLQIVRRVESTTAKQEYLDKLLDLQFYVSFVVAARAIGNAHIPPRQLAALDVSTIDNSIFEKAFEDVFKVYREHGEDANASKSAKMREGVILMMENEIHADAKQHTLL